MRRSRTKSWALALALTLPITGCDLPRNHANTVKKHPAARTVVEGANAFGLDVFRELGKEGGDNLFFSPISLSMALYLTLAGARSESEAELRNLLRVPEGEGVHAAVGALMQDLNRMAGVELAVANALWGQAGAGILPAYLALTKEHYEAGLREVDFERDPDAARKTINAWVEEKTKKKIQNLFAPGSLTPLTRLVLTNAIYFKGDWALKFEKDRTQDGAFTRRDGTVVEVPMMFSSEKVSTFRGPIFHLLEKTYEGEEVSFVVLLPATPGALPDLIQRLKPEDIDSALKQARVMKTNVGLPRIKIESSFNLNETMKALGLRTALTPDADFSGINGKKKDLFVQQIVHKAYVEVNEEGTEAAAATGIALGTLSMPPQFLCDRPFLFFIRDRQSGAILFAGRVEDPS